MKNSFTTLILPVDTFEEIDLVCWEVRANGNKAIKHFDETNSQHHKVWIDKVNDRSVMAVTTSRNSPKFTI